MSSVRLTNGRMTYVSELSTAMVTLDRKVTRAGALHANVRPLLGGVQIKFTISRQSGLGLRDEVGKASLA